MQTIMLCTSGVFSTAFSRYSWCRAEAEFGGRRVAVGQQTATVRRIGPGPGDHPGAVGRRGGGEHPLEDLVQLGVRGQPGVDQPLLQPADPGRDGKLAVLPVTAPPPGRTPTGRGSPNATRLPTARPRRTAPRTPARGARRRARPGRAAPAGPQLDHLADVAADVAGQPGVPVRIGGGGADPRPRGEPSHAGHGRGRPVVVGLVVVGLVVARVVMARLVLAGQRPAGPSPPAASPPPAASARSRTGVRYSAGGMRSMASRRSSNSGLITPGPAAPGRSRTPGPPSRRGRTARRRRQAPARIRSARPYRAPGSRG